MKNISEKIFKILAGIVIIALLILNSSFFWYILPFVVLFITILISKKEGTRIKVYILLMIIITISLLSFYTIPKSSKPDLGYQKNMGINPPPPRNLSGTLMADRIELHWDKPETVNVPHNYSDIITQYNIYRGTSVENVSYLTSTSNLTFADYNISASPQYVYEVTAVHLGNTESVPSQEIVIKTLMTTPSRGKSE